MVLNADVFSWGRNVEGQLGDNTTESTFTPAATAYPVENRGANDDFEILNIARDEVIRGVTTSIPASAARWGFAKFTAAGSGDDLWEIDDETLHWDGSGRVTDFHTYGWLDSHFRLHSYRWNSYDYEVQIDFNLLQFDQPSVSENSIRLYLWNSTTGYAFISRRYQSGGANEYRLFGTTTGTVNYATTDMSGKFKFEMRGGVLIAYIFNETAQQWEWNGNTAGYTMSEDFAAPAVRLLTDQYQDGELEVEFDNFQVIGQPPDGNNIAGLPDYERDVPGFVYWEQPQSAQGDIGNPYLEFSGDTPGTTANNIQRQYRTYDGSQDVIHPLIEGATIPFFTVTGGNLYFDGVANNPNGARDLQSMVIFESDFEVIWETNIGAIAPNTCCWSTRLSCIQRSDSTTDTVTYEPEYGYSGSRRYRVWKNPGTGGAWQNSTARTDTFIRIKIIHRGNDWEAWGWWNGIWNQLGSSMTQTVTHNPTVLTWRFSNWSVWPGFQADLQSLTIVPSGTPDGSYYYADAPYVPSPSGYTDETAILVGDPQFEDMTGGVNHAIGLKEDGSAFAWGDNQFGQLGDGTLVNKSSPVSVQGNHSFTEIAPAADHNLALKADGSLFSWGRNDFGQLGFFAPSGSTEENLQDLGYPCRELTEENLPWIFDGLLSGVGQVLETATGTIWTWGSGALGNHGQGLGFAFPNTTNPGSVLGGHSWTAMGLGSNHMIAITADGDVYGWGNNSNGQLGTGVLTGYDSPNQALALPGGIKAMHPGSDWMCENCNKHGMACGGDEWSLFIGEDRQVYGMGRNSNVRGGALGNGTYTNYSSPVSCYQNLRIGEVICGESQSYGINWSWEQGIEENPNIQGQNISPIWGNRPRGTWMPIGQVWATGQNESGELGDGTKTSVNSPVRVGIPGNWFYANRVSAGARFACGAAMNEFGGRVFCWGSNWYGKLGDGVTGTTSNDHKSTPTAVFGQKAVKDFSCGQHHVCALDANDGSMWCWGRGTEGQLGTGVFNISVSSPVSVLGGHSYISVGCTGNATCGMLENGDIYCWGPGRLSGFPGTGSYNSPVLLPPISPARIPASPIFIADTTDYLNCDDTKVYSPVSVDAIYIAAATGLDHSLAIDRDMQVWAWGRNDAGQLGTGDTIDKNTPTLVNNLPAENFVKVTGGKKHSCAMTELGDVWCWGNNTYNQAGPSGGGIYAQAYGLLHNMTEDARQAGWIGDDEIAWMAGDNDEGNLGDGTKTPHFLSSPVSIFNSYPSLYKPKWLKIGFGRDLGAGIRLGNPSVPTQLFTWGDNNDGSLGNNIPEIGGDRSTPVTMTQTGLAGVPLGNMPGDKFIDIAVGRDMFGCALREGGDVWCWGRNSTGQLGQGYFGMPWKSSAVSVLNTGTGLPVRSINYVFTHMSVGGDYVLTIDIFGDIWGWGSNANGKLGVGSGTSRNSPVSIFRPSPNPGSYIDIATGLNSSGGIKREGGPFPDEWQYPDVFGGTAWCWGGALYGVLGNGTYSGNKSTPVSVLGNHVFTKLEIGTNHVCALDHTGHPWCWGRNSLGELGIGSASGSRNSPVSCLGGPFSFADIKLGSQWTIAVTEDGTIYTWGSGGGFFGNNTVPVPTTLQQGQPSFEFNSLVPQLVSGGPFIDVDCGGDHSMTLDDVGQAWGWGRNVDGQLGDNSLTDRISPVSVYGNHKFVDISAGENHTFAMKVDGTICTWGAGDWGKLLWNEDENRRSIPVCGTIEGIACVPFLPNTGNYAHSTFMQCGSQFIAWTWGCNTDGKLGDGTISNRSTPTQVIGNKRWIDMSGGGDFTIAIDTDGRIHAWGDDSKGQLGDG